MENRVVLVTGGASGIGKGMVRMFADRGCQEKQQSMRQQNLQRNTAMKRQHHLSMVS